MNWMTLVGNVILPHPQCGEEFVTGYLRNQGHHIQRERIRQSIRRVDLVGVEARTRSVLHCQRYHVQAPNAMAIDIFLFLLAEVT